MCHHILYIITKYIAILRSYLYQPLNSKYEILHTYSGDMGEAMKFQSVMEGFDDDEVRAKLQSKL